MFTAWFHGGPLLGGLRLEPKTTENVVADLQEALIPKLGQQFYEIYKAVKTGTGATASWGKTGDVLDVKQSLSDVFGELKEMDFFLELAIAG